MAEETALPDWRNDSIALARVFSSLGNHHTGLGTARDKTSALAINIEPYILSREELSALPRQNAVLKRAITLYPEDAAADWIEITFGESNENPATIIDYMRELADREGRYSVREAVKESSIVGRQHGDKFCLLGVADGKEPHEPIDWESVQSFRWIKPVSRYQLRPDYQIWGDARHPEHFILAPNVGANLPKEQERVIVGSKWHRDRVLRFVGSRLYDEELERNGGYNDSILQSMFDAWSKYQQGLMASSAMLADYSQMIFRSEKLGEELRAAGGRNGNGKTGQENVLNRLLALDMGRSVAKAVLLDKSNEDAEYVNRSYSGADSILKALLDEWVAAADMPRDKLLGSSNTNGLGSTTGLADRWAWAQSVARWQNSNWRAPLEHVARIILHAQDGPTGGAVPEGWGLEFVDTFKLTRKEELELRRESAEIDKVSIPLGIYSAEEARGKFSGAEFTPEITLREDKATRNDYSYVQRVLKYQGLELGIEDKPGDRHRGKRMSNAAYAHVRRHGNTACRAYVSGTLLEDLATGAEREGDRYFRLHQKSGDDLYFFGFPSAEHATNLYERYYGVKAFGGVEEIGLEDIQALRRDASAEDIRVGATVSWRWNGGTATGNVMKIYTRRVTLTINGNEITRNGSENDPALQIEQENGSSVLKLASEVRVVKVDAAVAFVPRPEVLPSINELLALADVSSLDVEQAAKIWRENPPDSDFGSILGALEQND